MFHRFFLLLCGFIVLVTVIIALAPAYIFPGKIVFISSRDGPGVSRIYQPQAIYVMDAHRLQPTRLTNPGLYYFDETPAVSPDGVHIVFRCRRSSRPAAICRINTDGAGLVHLTDDAVSAGDPAWSRDGTRIAFTSVRNRNIDIYAMRSDGSNLVRLTDHPADDRQPTWGPGDAEIAFVTGRDGNAEIYTLDLQQATLTNVTRSLATESSPAWSPDGTKIAFVAFRDGATDIYRMDADGSNRRQLTHTRDTFGGPARADDPAWSPDGRYIVFTRSTYGSLASYSAIYVMLANGAGQVPITDSGKDSHPSWGP